MALLLKYWWVIGIALIAFGVYLLVDEYNEAQRENERSKVTIDQQGSTITQVEEANEVRNDITSPDNTVFYCQCLRSSRDTSSCGQFLPARYKDNGEPAPECKKAGRPRQ